MRGSVFFFLLTFLISTTAFANEYSEAGPLKTRIQNPVMLQMLTLPMERAKTLPVNQWETSVQTAFSNLFEIEIIGNTTLRFDMELWRTALQTKYGVFPGFEIGIEIPFISTTAGFLDPFIQWYHGLFGLPNAGRDLFPNNEFNFTLSQNGRQLANYDAIAFGLSDIVLNAKYELPFSKNFPVTFAVSPYVKLPTGKNSKGIGSGHFDFGTQILAEWHIKRFHFYSQLGLVAITGHNQFESILHNFYLQFGQSIEFSVTKHFSILAQITGNSIAFKNTSANDTNQIGMDLNVGFAGRIPIKDRFFDEIFYQASFAEDLTSTGPSIDFTTFFLFGVRY